MTRGLPKRRKPQESKSRNTIIITTTIIITWCRDRFAGYSAIITTITTIITDEVGNA
jgi:hypothetical protein